MQLHGQIIASDVEFDPETGSAVPGTGKVGIVESVGTATVAQPDRVTVDAVTGEEVHREAQPNLEVQEVHVVYEDGTTGDLTELVDSWTVLGSVVSFPPVGDPEHPASGSSGELPEQKAEIDAAVADVANCCAQFVAADAEARAAVDRPVVVHEDGVLSKVTD